MKHCICQSQGLVESMKEVSPCGQALHSPVCTAPLTFDSYSQLSISLIRVLDGYRKSGYSRSKPEPHVSHSTPVTSEKRKGRKDINALTQLWSLHATAPVCQARSASGAVTVHLLWVAASSLVILLVLSSWPKTKQNNNDKKQKQTSEDVTGPRAKHAIVILLNAHLVKLPSKSLCLYP